MTNLKTIGIIFFLTSFWIVQSARILGIYPLPGTSHYRLGSSLFRELAERGHDVTVINTFGEDNPPKKGNYKDILINDLFEQHSLQNKRKEWNMFKREGMNPFVGAYFVSSMTTEFIPKALNHTKIQKLLHSTETFDVVIVDNFLTDAFKAFATHFNAPLIAISPVWANHWINSLVGNPSPPSYVSNILSNYYHPMSFCERLSNTLLNLFNYLVYQFKVYPVHNEFVKKFIPKGGELNDILYNTSLVLLNSHPSLNQPVPLVPNMIEVGGFHMKPPKPLPKDLQDFLDNAREGVIYFSMGSNLQGVQFPPEKRQAFIDAFSQLKLKVLWKWENDQLPGKPENVRIEKWLPQSDLLAHPNVKLFITHGGFVSSIETAYHGVPTLTIPIYGDQMQNAKFAVTNGFGRYLTYNELSAESLLETIQDMLKNPKYKQNAIKRSVLFHDRLVSPMDTAVYWVEYVIKHRGAPHLQVAGVKLAWYQYFLVDVISVLILVFIMSTLITCFTLKMIFGKKPKNLVKSKKSKKGKHLKKL